jgi:hypothetical protein
MRAFHKIVLAKFFDWNLVRRWMSWVPGQCKFFTFGLLSKTVVGGPITLPANRGCIALPHPAM